LAFCLNVDVLLLLLLMVVVQLYQLFLLDGPRPANCN
jgi:hypothetical protein